MSAFICSDRHIATVADHVFADADDAQRFADKLKRENIRSVNARYKERTRFVPVDMTQSIKDRYTPTDVCWMLQCLDYQSCEHIDYDATLITLAIDLLIARGANHDRDGSPTIWSI
jgi:hypothetical protein